jgi:competence protein ComEA
MRWLPIAVSVLSLSTFMRSAPQDDDLPAGEGKAALMRSCVACHGVAQITAQRYSRKYWGSVVDDMISRGADASDDDVPLIVSYLSANFGKPVNVNSASAKEIEDGLSFSPADAQKIVQYRTDKGPFQTFEDLRKVPGLDAKLLDEQKKNIQF